MVVFNEVLPALAATVVDVVKGGKRLVLHAAAGGEETGEEQGGEGFHGGMGRGYGDMLKVLYRAHHRGCLQLKNFLPLQGETRGGRVLIQNASAF